ncbi:MAG: preprotein translocase subunit SecA [Alphaproteobacteria bacterium CG_4_10_14_0_2_um_filter_63_37]|nr:MAG: preprotein translocase subunit SecA [Proteobacteria bacterium CG1_02_64_396]PJA24920.1 MAG: preprotein translocase subunit SecA [Alphaproteobacteria bacterium CG_4_10_14_0_2_um_filter_63_37]
MIGTLVRKIVGSKNDREIKRLKKTVQRVNALEEQMQGKSDEQLTAQTALFRQRLEQGEKLDDLLPEAFATVREAGKRVLGMRHFDVQLMGGVVLHEGKIAEMKTGEGKTLVATLPVYLNALTGKGVHVVTVNDYLARRDAEWMGQIYRFLGMSVGIIVHGMDEKERQIAYGSDITYGTNNEYGFDYLRDNMKFRAEDLVQRPLHFAIVDEVDSILIDEARTPLIISGPTEDRTDKYALADNLIADLTAEDYTVDEKSKTVVLTEEGNEKVERLLGLDNLYDLANVEMVHHVNQALRAHQMFKRDVDYIVRNGEVVIIDEFTGRMMPGRRYSDGLHQALEAKEKVAIQNENQTLASITFQNYFRMYDKLAGMTGTADTEAVEFHKIYELSVVVMPPNRPVQRIDQADVVYRNLDDKFAAIIEDIRACHEKGQPVLVGTVSIEKSEMLAKALAQAKVAHEVLNAKQHEREAFIVAQAGRKGAVTIATNMAGRGTDIVLGGNPEMRLLMEFPDLEGQERETKFEVLRQECITEKEEVMLAGGLRIIGTERHESRRIDNQLRGRAGRQGDPGSSRFYIALTDDLMRIFGSERMDKIMVRMGMQPGEALVHPWLTKSIEMAQKKVEGRNFDIRKQLLDYDDVMNEQRKVVYSQRREVMDAADVSDYIESMREDTVDQILNLHLPPTVHPEMWEVAAATAEFQRILDLDLPIQTWVTDGESEWDDIRRNILEAARSNYLGLEGQAGSESLRQVERMVLLQVLDGLWKDHLLTMDHLREGIHLRGYAQQDPKREYKKESFLLFQQFLDRVRSEVVAVLHHLKVSPPDVAAMAEAQAKADAERARLAGIRPDLPGTPDADGIEKQHPVVRSDKIGRNDPCPCGSGKKFKHCHGKAA